MLLIPALDLRGGKCVRLAQGDPTRERTYDDDPVERAKRFVKAGARRLHVIDLDGALGSGENLAALRAICGSVEVPVQTGGGIRSADDVLQRIQVGAASIVIGTLFVENPEEAKAIVARYSQRIIGGVDARGSYVAVRGWQRQSAVDRDTLIAQMESWGVQRIVYTEITRDGMGRGYDLDALAAVSGLTKMKVTANGGAHTLADLQALAAIAPPNLDSAIIGRALYEGTIDLAEALAAL